MRTENEPNSEAQEASQVPEQVERPEDAAGIPREKVLLISTLFLIFVLCIALDVLLPQYFTDAWPGLILMNLVVGQLTLMCVWETMVKGTFWVRLPWTFLMLVVSWGALSWGAFLAAQQYGTPFQKENVFVIGMFWFYGFVISYIPLKLATLIFGWRIAKSTKVGEQGGYAIRDIMIGTALLAVALSIGKSFVPGDLPSFSKVWNTGGFDRVEPLIALFIFSVISLIVKLPCIWIALASDARQFWRKAVTWILLSGAFGLIEYFIIITALGPPGALNNYEFVLALVVGHMCMAIMMIGVLAVLRKFGYTISRTKRPMKAVGA